jgi:sulfite reductase alpha subunit-like flavoprotein
VWLIYGCQNRDRELYASEMENAVDRRALSKYLVCYSRDPDVMPKTYVDQRVRENADAVKDMILRGGHVYVCGDIRIEQSVNGALADILGDDYEDFEKSARYHLDIFGAFDIQRQLDQRLTSARKSLSMRKSFRNVVT